MDDLKEIYRKIWELAEPYLHTRDNDLHTRLATGLVGELLEEEPGDEDIVVPAIILHDTGWTRVPEEEQLKAYGPRANAPEITLLHEKEGVKIAEEILERVRYDREKTRQILAIIDGHDSRPDASSSNGKIVRDADKLTRYEKELHLHWMKRLKHIHPQEAVRKLNNNIDHWFFTDTAKSIARRKIQELRKLWSS